MYNGGFTHSIYTCNKSQRLYVERFLVKSLKFNHIGRIIRVVTAEQLHLAPWQQPVQLTPYFSLRKLQGDAYSLLSEASEPDASSPENSSFLISNSSLFDVVYFDAFAPEKQPEMWTPELFQAIYRHMAPGGILTTYCAKGVVRRLLQATGFHVERLPGPPGGKREILRATKVSG